MSFYTLNALRHPLTALRLVVRRALVRLVEAHDAGWPDLPETDLPPALRQFTVGELLPWKGVDFRVGKVVGGKFPVVMLVPIEPTKGAKLQTMRSFRHAARLVRKG